MIKPEQVPDEVVATLVNALYDNRVDVAWSDAIAAIAATISAWPGMRLGKYRDVAGDNDRIILPLPPQEASDE